MKQSFEDQYEKRVDGETAADNVINLIEECAGEIRDEQVEQALSTLDNNGKLTPEQRATITELADRITRQLITPVTAQLQAADESDDEILAVALKLFDESHSVELPKSQAKYES